MYIRFVTIEGFRSYKNRVVYGPFDSGINTIIGLNGSGKSNFYKALEFVISDEQHKMREIERKSLLYSGNGSLTESGSVEIKFSNEKRVFPIDLDEVSITRVINHKKDFFLVNSKKTPRDVVKNLFFCAGLSKTTSNFVKQGYMNTLSMMTNEKRFSLLMDISGIEDYLIKKGETLKVLNDNISTKQLIEKRLNELNESSKYIESQCASLKIFRDLEKVLCSTEENIRNNERKLKYIQQQNNKHEMGNIVESLTLKHSLINGIKENNHKLKIELLQVRENEEVLVRSIKEKYINLDRMSNSESIAETKLESINFDLSLQKQIYNEKQIQIVKIDNELSSKQTDYKKSKKHLTLLSSQIIFNEAWSINDNCIENEINEINERMTLFRSNISEEISMNIELDKEKSQKKEILDIINDNIKEMGLLKTEEALQKKEICQIESEIAMFISSNKQVSSDYSIIQKHCNNNLPRKFFRLVKFVEEMKKKRHSILGLFFSLFEYDESVLYAINSISKNRLLDIVVETEDDLIWLMNERYGFDCINFSVVVLSRVKFNGCRTHNEKSLDYFINYDKRIANLIKSVYGNVVLCSSIKDAYQMMKQYHVSCATVDGYVVFSNGFSSGGSIRDYKVELSILSSYLKKRSAFENYSEKLDHMLLKLNDSKVRLSDIRNDLSSKEILDKDYTWRLNLCESHINQITCSLERLYLSNQPLKGKIEHLNGVIEILQSRINDRIESIPNVNNSDIIKHNSLKYYQLSEHVRLMEQEQIELGEKKKSMGIEFLIIKIKSLEKDYSETQCLIKDYEKTKEMLEADLEKLNKDILMIQNQKDILSNSLVKNETAINELEIEIDSLRAKYNQLNTSIMNYEECNNQTTLDCLDSNQMQNLRERLISIKEQIESLGYINLSADFEYDNILCKLNDLIQKRQEIFCSDDSMTKIIGILDDKKDQEFEKCFQEVSYWFSIFFEEMVPKGKANLIMKNGSISLFVVFPSSYPYQSTPSSMIQLSGGQKTIVSLALVLSIQKFNKAPFVLFDEVDSALDPVFRESLARLLESQKSNIQFFITTFKPEVLSYSDLIIKVQMNSCVTMTEVISVEEGKKLIQNY